MDINKILEQHSIYLSSAGVRGERANLSLAALRDADLRYAALRDADLSNADLSNADLRLADLRYADLSDADLSSADLRYADLSGAGLRRANLSGANLSGANLSGANLSGANLSGADLRGADLSGAELPEKTWVITGEIYFISIANGNSLRAGCQTHSVEDWRKFSKNAIAEMDGKDALRFYPHLLDILDSYLGTGERPEWVK